MSVAPPLLRRLWLWGPVIAQMAIIFVFSSIPDIGELPGGTPDWFGHAAGYAILGGLLLRALAGGRRTGVTSRVVLAATVLATLYGATDEWHQSFVSGRTPASGDLAVDAFGSAVAAGLGWLWSAAVSWRRASTRAAAPDEHSSSASKV
jgi:VanZ family protein